MSFDLAYGKHVSLLVRTCAAVQGQEHVLHMHSSPEEVWKRLDYFFLIALYVRPVWIVPLLLFLLVKSGSEDYAVPSLCCTLKCLALLARSVSS